MAFKLLVGISSHLVYRGAREGSGEPSNLLHPPAFFFLWDVSAKSSPPQWRGTRGSCWLQKLTSIPGAPLSLLCSRSQIYRLFLGSTVVTAS